MRTNKLGRELIITFEGIRTNAYPDPASKDGHPWTIGIGATGPGIGPGVVWTEKQIRERFEADLLRFESELTKEVNVIRLNENQFSALVCLIFNIGTGAFHTSTIRRRINQADYADAALEFPKWIHSGGKVVDGLRRRRLAEQSLFLRPVVRDLA